jgi:Sulfotransferase family
VSDVDGPTGASAAPGTRGRRELPGRAIGTIPVLYVGGWGRSGSTLLDRMLGQLSGFCSLGEVREIWQHGVKENRPCGCGRPFLSCPFWSEVGQRAFGGWDRLDLDQVLQLRYSLDRPWSIPALLSWRRPDPDSPLGRYLAMLGRLYGAIHDVSGANVIVDSSKLPSHALLLRKVPGIDLRMLHLVRDSRGVAFSWKKHVQNRVTSGEDRFMERYGPVSASLRYLLYNSLTRLVGALGVPYRRARYEDLIAEPSSRLRAIARHAEPSNEDVQLDFVQDDHVRLEPNHTADGNEMRFAVGDVKIRLDDEWGERMDRRDRVVVTVLTSPLLLLYRYGLRSPLRRGRP